MRHSALTFAVGLLLSLLAPLAAHGQIGWHDNLRQAHAQAEQRGKLLLLHFYSDNCVWCDKLDAGAFRVATVTEAIQDHFVPVKINASVNPELAEMFKVNRFPTDIVVTTSGQKLSHQVSPQDPEQYVAMLTKTLPAATPQTTQLAAAQTQAPQAAVPDPVNDDSTPPANSHASDPQITLPPSIDTRLAAANSDQQGQAQMAGFHEEDWSLTMPEAVAPPAAVPTAASLATAAPTAAPAAAPTAPAMAPTDPELAMEGFCAVTVITQDKWVEGKPEFGVIHLGKLYLFENEQAMNTFLADPVPYTPVLNEIDVVRFFEERKIVAGKREWGVKDPNYQRMFFFADEAAMNHFIEEHHRYTEAAVEVMEQAVKDANPQS